MKEYVLEVRNISKRRGGKVILDNVSFSVRRGEVFVILGPPGSGKTTLLKIIAGLEAQDLGDIMINGEIVNMLPPYRRNVAMVFETLALYANMTVFENIASPLIAQGKDREHVAKRVREIASLLRIEHILDRRADKLSGGERQRVAIARALAKEADIYLLDEPFLNLDAKIRYALRTEFKKLKSILGRTIILATSDPYDALTLGDRVLLLNYGRVVHEGTPTNIYKTPRSISIARYLTGNMVNEVFIMINGNGKIASSIGRDIYINSEVHDMILKLERRNLILANYIDSCFIDRHITECSGVKIKGSFLGYEFRGSEYLVYARTGDVIFKSLSRILPPGLNTGDEVDICLTREGMIIFDGETGDFLG